MSLESTSGAASADAPPQLFATTHWSVVMAAREPDSPQARVALENLCRTYWYPLYAYIRRQGHDIHRAQDLTQEFFSRLLEGNFLEAVQRERGKFRWFLLSAVKRFLVNEWNREQALKRGGSETLISLDEAAAEARYQIEPVDELTPEKMFDRNWAMTLLERAQARLGKEYARDRTGPLFDELKVFLSGDRGAVAYADVATKLGLTEGAVKQAIHRLRRRYREILRGEIAHTVATAADIDDEIQSLFAAFGS